MARRKPARSPQRKRRPKPKAKGGFGLPVLEQHHRDLIGLGLVAFAAFLAFVLYLGAAGGRVGEAVEDGLRFLMGGAAVLTPPALCAAGVVLVLHDSLPSVKPFRAGALCLLLGVTLGLAAGTLGLGPGAHDHAPLLDPGYVSDRGGALGELLYAGSSQLFSDLGSHIIFLFLVTGGVLLLTGASIAGVVARTRDGVSATTEAVKRSTSELTAVLREPAPPQRPVRKGRPSRPVWSRSCTPPTWRRPPWTPRRATPTCSEPTTTSPRPTTSPPGPCPSRAGARGDRAGAAGRARRGGGGARRDRGRGRRRARPGAADAHGQPAHRGHRGRRRGLQAAQAPPSSPGPRPSRRSTPGPTSASASSWWRP